ncbi:MAG: phosphonate ABC transporter ATP-binding protein [Rhizobiaceae bacterium]|jgi:phosphonate transport system ATP-binding protein|nr:phosphonate ABC transporter ATP-binding protein [Rhizobiaceae bacterium]
MKAVTVKNLSKTFGAKNRALDNVSVDVEDGEMVALIGASGSGKSTLLRHIAGLVESDRNAGSSVVIFGDTMQRGGRITANARKLRSRVGVVFQQFNLVSRLKVLTNVLLGNLGTMPRWKGTLGLFSKDQKQTAMEALERVGIAPQALQRGSTLSGGQQQRAAIARTLVQGAKLLIADEPIASLDPSSARKVMNILRELNQKDRITVLVSLHQVEYALNYCPRTIALRNGEVVYDGPSERLTPEFLGELYGAESEELFLPGMQAGNKPTVTKPKSPALKPALA